jgi:hypothetical protein
MSTQYFDSSHFDQSLTPPLLRLPAELLSAINTHAASADPPTRMHLGWLTLGHVCTRLRAVLLAQHLLWAAVVCTFPCAHAELAERAGDTPLCISLDDALGEVSCATAEFAMACVGRARSICVVERTKRRKLWTLAPAALAGAEVPHLESITFKTLLPWTPFDVATYDLPLLRAPALRRVYLENAFVPFDARTLTHLTLRATRRGEGSIDACLPSAAHFVSMLRACSRLEELRLYGWVPELPTDTGDEPDRETSTINLPCLRELYIWAPLARCAALFARLRIPRTALFDLSLDNIDLDAAGEPLLPPLPSYPGAAHDDTLRLGLLRALGAQLDGARPSGLCVALRPGADHVRFVLFDGSPASGTTECVRRLLDIEFCRWALDAKAFARLVDVLHTSFDLGGVETLEVQCHSPTLGAGRIWREALKPLKNIKTARANFFGVRDAGQVVCEMFDAQGGEKGPVPFPEMVTLGVTVQGQFAIDGMWEGRNEDLHGEAREGFVRMLRRREGRGCAVERVEARGMGRGHFGEQFLEEVRRVVREVFVEF